MEKYRYLEHTADAKFESYGKTLEEAFENATLAMANITADTSTIEPKIKKELSIKSENLGSLLYDWLERLITLTELEGYLINNIKIKKIKKKDDYYILAATTQGDTYRQKYELKTEVKAITYNDMLIKQDKNTGIWKITAVVDI
ncbi:MAG: archease [archaeon]